MREWVAATGWREHAPCGVWRWPSRLYPTPVCAEGAAGTRWAQAPLLALERGQDDRVRETLEVLATEHAAHCLDSVDQVDYPAFLAQRYPVGSDRMKWAGMLLLSPSSSTAA